MRFYQACYGKPNNVNWSLYNISDDISADMCNFYERAENRNTPQNLTADDMTDAQGNPVCIREVLAQDGFIAYSKIQYGTKDNLGRAKMTAHGYLFSAEDGALKDPNMVFALSDSNFKFDVEETKIIPEQLEYDAPYTLESAIKNAGIDAQCFLKFLSCIYVSITSPTDFPIYVYSARAKEVMFPLMYCVCLHLPYSLRYMLSFSDANNLSKSPSKSIMFVDKKYEGAYYFDLDTGETNVDLEELEERADRYPFYYRLKTKGTTAFLGYCDKLQQELDNMQMSNTTDYGILKLADVFLQDESYVKGLGDQELMRFLLETLGGAPLQNSYIDTKMYGYLTEFFERGLSPNEALMHRLRVRSEKTPAKELVVIYRQLQMKSLMDQGEKAVVDFLAEQRSVSEDRFVDWKKYVENINGGYAGLEKYYVRLMGQAQTFDRICAVREECPVVSRGNELGKAIEEQGRKILRAQLRESIDMPYAFTNLLDTYREIYQSVHQNDPETFFKVLEEETEIFWRTFDFRKFEFSEVKFINFRCVENETSKVYRFVNVLMKFYDVLENNKTGNVSPLEYVGEILPKIRKCDGYINEQQWDIVAPVLQAYIVKRLSLYKSSDFMFWREIATLTPKVNLYKSMIDWEINALLDEHLFEKNITDMQSAEKTEKLVSELAGDSDYYGLIEDFASDSDEYRMLKKRITFLNELLKRYEKERRAEAKAELKASKEEKERQKAEEKERQRLLALQSKMESSKNDVKNAPEQEGDEKPVKKGFSFANFNPFGNKTKKK